MINIAIVDDNELDASRLENSIISYCKNNNIPFNINKCSRAINFLEEFDDSYDCIFLDIDMPIMDGMECAYKIREKSPKVNIIFETNYSSLAIRGYGVSALGFLVKPVKQVDVDNILEKVLNELEKEKDETKIVIRVKSGFQTIRLSEIKYIEVDMHDIYYHCVNGDYLSRGVLKDIEISINSEKFAKCSNCYLINLDYVESIIKDDVKIDNKLLKISRNKKKQFINAYLKNFN